MEALTDFRGLESPSTNGCAIAAFLNAVEEIGIRSFLFLQGALLGILYMEAYVSNLLLTSNY